MDGYAESDSAMVVPAHRDEPVVEAPMEGAEPGAQGESAALGRGGASSHVGGEVATSADAEASVPRYWPTEREARDGATSFKSACGGYP